MMLLPWALASLVLLGKGSIQLSTAWAETQEECDAVHRDATQVKQYRIDLRREGLPRGVVRVN